MNNPLHKVHEILQELETDISKMRSIWKGIQKDNPHFEQVSDPNWDKKWARIWLHGATKLDECNELERWLFDNPPQSDTAKTSAAHCVKCWRKYLKLQDAYYVDFDEFDLPETYEDETLRDYLARLAKMVEDEGPGHRLEWRALKSFLAYLRNLSKEEVAFIEQIFPFKMDIYYSRIIRLIEPEVYAIPQKTAANILYELSQICLNGRPNIQHSAAETLGLCWLCLCASRLRLPITLEDIHITKNSSIILNDEQALIMVPTLFGDRPLKISRRMAQFFLTLSEINPNGRITVLQKNIRVLRRVLEKAIENARPNPKFGKITFITFISAPHIHGDDYRYVPKN